MAVFEDGSAGLQVFNKRGENRAGVGVRPNGQGVVVPTETGNLSSLVEELGTQVDEMETSAQDLCDTITSAYNSFVSDGSDLGYEVDYALYTLSIGC
jgi:hypothetical protein